MSGKGWHPDQHPGLARRQDLKHYGEGGNLHTPSHAGNLQQRGARAPGDQFANGRVRTPAGNMAPTESKLLNRPKRIV
jgi:hypothetical protein